MTNIREQVEKLKVHPDYIEGYMDGYDLDAPVPSGNRSERYKHSFEVGRAEKSGTPLDYAFIKNRLEKLEKELTP